MLAPGVGVHVLLGGSRALPGSASPLLASSVLSVLSINSVVHVGCAAGADAVIVSSVLAAGSASHLSLFCIGSASGAGFWSGSASFSLLSQAVISGASVTWCAGGALSLPLRARLFRRSCAAMAGCSSAVFFLSSPSSPGSLRVATAAFGHGIPVFVFPFGFSGPPAALAGVAGAWVPGSFASHRCWAWQPAQSHFF